MRQRERKRETHAASKALCLQALEKGALNQRGYCPLPNPVQDVVRGRALHHGTCYRLPGKSRDRLLSSPGHVSDAALILSIFGEKPTCRVGPFMDVKTNTSPPSWVSGPFFRAWSLPIRTEWSFPPRLPGPRRAGYRGLRQRMRLLWRLIGETTARIPGQGDSPNGIFYPSTQLVEPRTE